MTCITGLRLLSVVITALCFIGASPMHGQSLFTKVAEEMRTNRFDQLESREDVASVSLIEIDTDHFNLPEATIALGGETKVLRRDSRQEVGAVMSWTGSSTDEPLSATFRVQSGKVSGLISGMAGVYEIIPLEENGGHALIQYDPSSFGSCATPESTPSSSGDSGHKQGGLQRTNSDECIVRLLIAYTPGAQANTMELYNRTMIEHVSLAIDLMNASFENSLSNQRVELAHLYKTQDTESGNITTDINDLKDTEDGKWDEIHEIRDQYHADMVALITDGSYEGTCGRAYGFDYASEEKMFQISEYDCVVSNLTLAHEFGHLQGARHDIDGNQTPFSFGHGYSQGSSYRTIMAVCCGAPRVNYWSNPYVYYPGVGSMGTLDYNYNALATGTSYGSVVFHRATPTTLATDDMLMTDHIATNSAPGEVHSTDTTAVDGCLILESKNRIVLKPGFKAYDGALGTYRIVSGCDLSDPMVQLEVPVTPQSSVQAQTPTSKEKK